jgi:CNT family concentrative nucleoside transporter
MEYHDVTRNSDEKGERHSGGPRPSEATVSHDIAPRYKSDPDIEEDIEKGNVAKSGDSSSEELPRKVVPNEDLRNEEEVDDEPGVIKTYWRRYRPFGHAIIWLLVTAWWICGLVLHRDKWLIPSLLYIAICLWFIFAYVPVRKVTKPVYRFWGWSTRFFFTDRVPERLHIPLGFALVISVIIVATFASPTSPDNSYKNRGISIAGLVIFYLVLYATSANRKKIVWRTVLVGLLCQFLLALFVLRTKAGYDIFNFISFLARELLSFANAGTIFLTAPNIPTIGPSRL